MPEEYTELRTAWRAPSWLLALVVLYLLIGASGGIWFGVDRLADW